MSSHGRQFVKALSANKQTYMAPVSAFYYSHYGTTANNFFVRANNHRHLTLETDRPLTVSIRHASRRPTIG